MGATVALTAASGVATMMSSSSQASALRSQGAYEQQIYESNSRLAMVQADDAITRGNRDATEQLKQTKKLIGSQRAALAAQGIEVGSGSSLDIQQDTAAMGASDALTIKNNAWREAWGFKNQALDYSSKGALAGMTAKNQAKNTILTGGLTFAKDAASAYSSYQNTKYYRPVKVK